uniref:Uncharacterized protein n=1 Tax=viral metagenome TaxID=1070528 RepID=A0A6H1ZNY9_9ZZZZ
MKLIEAMKQVKDLLRKADDLQGKTATFSAHHSTETPTYPDQKKQISEWLQSHSDILKEIMRLRVAIQRTNLQTNVDIELGGKAVRHTIAEWIHRRRDLAAKACSAWRGLTDKGLREGKMKDSQGNEVDVKIVRCYDPSERDIKVELYTAEPTIIDGRLEVINAVTDLVE